MIVVDTSALMAILLEEPMADACVALLESEDRLVISAGTVAEALIVSRRRNLGAQMGQMIEQLGFEVVDLTAARARASADAYDRWGKGVHPAGLNLADCFAYALAIERDCALLYVGGEFSRTDVSAALPDTGQAPVSR